MGIPRKGRLWLIIMYVYWFINCDNCTIQCKLLIIRELGGEQKEFSVIASQFYGKSKVLLKQKLC